MNLKTVAKKYRSYLWVVFISYVLVAFWFLFYQVGETDRATYFTSRKIYLIPFKSTYQSIKLAITNNFGLPHKAHYRYITVRNIFGNIFLFIPWGILAPILISQLQSLKKIILSTFAISIIIEITQFLFVVGVADIDDVLLNVIGGSLGFYAFSIMRNDQ